MEWARSLSPRALPSLPKATKNTIIVLWLDHQTTLHPLSGILP
jgi:hypothetical protein